MAGRIVVWPSKGVKYRLILTGPDSGAISRDLAATTAHSPPWPAHVTNLLCRAQAERTMQAIIHSGNPIQEVATPRAPGVSAFVEVSSCFDGLDFVASCKAGSVKIGGDRSGVWCHH